MSRFIKEHLPFALISHCIAHRIQLSINDTLKNDPLFCIIDKLIKSIYSQFSRIFAYSAELRRILKKLKLKLKKIKQSIITRWLSRRDAVISVIDSLLALLALFKHDEPQKIYNQLNQTKILLYIHYMADILCILYKIQTYFQNENNQINYGSLAAEMEFVTVLIHKASTRNTTG